MRPSTAAQVVRLFLFGALGIIAIAYAGVYFIGTTLINQQYAAEVTDALDNLRTVYDRNGLDALARQIEERIASNAGRDEIYLLQTRGGSVLAGNIGTWPSHVAPDGQWRTTKLLRWPNVTPTEIGIRAISLSDRYWLLVGVDLKTSSLLRKRLQGALAAAMVISAIVGIFGSYWLSRLLLRRVDNITVTVDEIMRGDLSRRVPVTSGRSDEFDMLARALNRMFDRLNELMATMRSISDSVAHDSRSALMRMRARLARLYADDHADEQSREVVAAILGEVDALLNSLSTLLQIARAEAGVGREQMSYFDLSSLARDLGELYQPVVEDAGMTLTVEAHETLKVLGHRQLLAQAIVNLIENAMKFSPQGGRITLRTLLGREGPVISVSDQGPGIRLEERERAMERFVQLDNTHTMDGVGLGLSLVAPIARLHNATFELSDNDPGLRAAIRFIRHGRR